MVIFFVQKRNCAKGTQHKNIEVVHIIRCSEDCSYFIKSMIQTITNPIRQHHPLTPNGNQSNFHALRVICRYCNNIDDDLTKLRSLLFQNVRIESDSWQHHYLTEDPTLASQRWRMTHLIEGCILDMEPYPNKYRNEIAAIAHVVEFYLFKTAPSFVMYDRVDSLCARIKVLLNYMFKRIIMISHERARVTMSSTRGIDKGISHFAGAA